MSCVPETPDQPVHSFDCGAELQSASNKTKKCFNYGIELLVLDGADLRSVLRLALFTENCAPEVLESRIQGAKLPETFITDIIDGIVVLRPGDFSVED